MTWDRWSGTAKASAAANVSATAKASAAANASPAANASAAIAPRRLPREGDQRIEIRPVHESAPLLEVADDVDQPTGERHRHSERFALLREHAQQAVHLRLAPAHGEIPPDARLRLRVAPVVGGGGRHRPMDGGLVPVERC